MAGNLASWLYYANLVKTVGIGVTAFVGLLTLLATILANKWQTELTAEKDDALHKFQTEAQDRISQNERQTAEANARAAEANQKAEQERLARLKIEEKLAPRSISDDQQIHAIAALTQFAGQPFNIITFNDDQEAVRLALQILRILTGAKWERKDFKEFLGFALVLGVQIEIPPSKAQQFTLASNTLANLLRAERLQVDFRANPEQEREPLAIHIKVGKKP